MNSIPRLATLCCTAAVFSWNLSAPAKLNDYQAAVTNEASIISYYTFDKSNALDVVSTNNGTAYGGATFRPGVDGVHAGLRLDGTGRVNLGQVPAFDFSDTTGSVEAWVRADWTIAPPYNPALFANRDGGPVLWSVHMNADKGAVGMWNGLAYQTLRIPSPGANWHHVAVVFDTGNMTIYWDGASIGTLTQGLVGSPQTTQLGSSSAGVTAEGWPGMLDEVAFYADALSDAQVLAHYQAFFMGTPPVIRTQPRGDTCLPGVTLALNVVATGPNLTYQWYKNGGLLTGKTDATLTFPSLAAADAGAYYVVVSNPAANVPSSNAVISVVTSVAPAVTSYQTAISNETSLLSHYEFDHLNALDAKGLHDGTLQGSAYFAPGIAGGPDQGLLLDGGGYVSLGYVSDFDFANGTGSVEAWARADWGSDIAYNPALFADRDGGLTTWSVHMNSDKRAIGMWNGMAYSTLPIPNAGTTWHHVVVVYDTGNMTIYWDGLALGTVPQAPGANVTPTQLGSSSAASTTEGWVGLLDEIAFYSGALSADSVQAHYRAFLGTAPPIITVEPVGGAFYPGRVLQLIVGATGAQRTYQWYKDGNPIAGATDWQLTFTSLAPTDAGSYTVTVSNPGGTTNSTPALVQVGLNLAGYQAAVRGESSLISYYTFDAGDAVDSHGTNNGSNVGNVTFAAGIGQSTDQALVLDGTGNIDLGQVPEFDFTNGTGTVEAWLRPDWTLDPGYDPCVFAARVASTLAVDWSIHMSRYRNSIGNWNGLFFQTLGLGDTTGWHHYAVAFGGGQVWMYWDGQSLGTFAQPIALTLGLPTQIGSSDPSTTPEGWIGGIDEVAFYRATLSADAIYNHFLAMVAPPSPPTITFVRSGNNLTLSWPPDVTGFTLESTGKLPATAWTPVGGVVNNQVTVPIGSGNLFFRLRK